MGKVLSSSPATIQILNKSFATANTFALEQSKSATGGCVASGAFVTGNARKIRLVQAIVQYLAFQITDLEVLVVQ